MMMLTQTTYAKQHDFFRIPFGSVMKSMDMELYFPEFAKVMDGKFKESCLVWYYQWTADTGIFELRSPNAELSVAELMGLVCQDPVQMDLEKNHPITEKEEIDFLE
jgi:hypothetical protein